MRLLEFATCFAVAVMTLCPGAQAQNELIINGGFEGSILSADTNILTPGNTFSFDNDFLANDAFAFRDNTTPFDGSFHGTLGLLLLENSFAGFAQQIDNITVGANYNFEFYGRSQNPTLGGINAEFRIEYLDSADNFIGGQFVNNVDISSSLTDSYQLFSQNSVAPVGATRLTAVVAVQSIGTGDGSNDNTGAIDVDNFSVTIVPEPTSLGLLGLAVTGLVIRRRRS